MLSVQRSSDSVSVATAAGRCCSSVSASRYTVSPDVAADGDAREPSSPAVARIESPRSCAYWIAFQRASCRGVGARSCLLPVSGLVVAPSLTTFTAAVAAGSVVSRRGAPPAPSPEAMRSGHVPQAGPQCPDRTPETGWPPRVRQAPYHLLGAMAPIWERQANWCLGKRWKSSAAKEQANPCRSASRARVTARWRVKTPHVRNAQGAPPPGSGSGRRVGETKAIISSSRSAVWSRDRGGVPRSTPLERMVLTGAGCGSSSRTCSGRPTAAGRP